MSYSHVERKPIAIEDLLAQPVSLWSRQWLLLCSGDFAAGDYNCMVVGWGALGRMWKRPLALIAVRSTRYTYQFINRYESFTLCAFPESCRPALDLLGSRSGHDGNKIAAAGLTPVAAIQVAAPVFAEAELTLECRKLYWDDVHPEQFLDPSLEENYPHQDYHRLLYGEILAVSGIAAYRSAAGEPAPA